MGLKYLLIIVSDVRKNGEGNEGIQLKTVKLEVSEELKRGSPILETERP